VRFAIRLAGGVASTVVFLGGGVAWRSGAQRSGGFSMVLRGVTMVRVLADNGQYRTALCLHLDGYLYEQFSDVGYA